MEENFLQSLNMKYKYPNAPLTFEFNFKIGLGQFVAIVGNSGCGKSTLISLIAGFLNPLEGLLLIHGERANRLLPHQRDIALLFQSHNTFSHLSVFENVALGLSPKLKITSCEEKNIFTILEELEIREFSKKKVKDLSGGQQQRVGLARCLAQKKSIIILDEPFSALEPSLRKDLIDLLAKKTRELKKIVLLVTHFPQEIKEIATHMLYIESGRVYGNYLATDFFSSPDPLIKKYLMLV